MPRVLIAVSLIAIALASYSIGDRVGAHREAVADAHFVAWRLSDDVDALRRLSRPPDPAALAEARRGRDAGGIACDRFYRERISQVASDLDGSLHIWSDAK